MSALPPITTAKVKSPPTVMSASPSKADMCGAIVDVYFGPKADIDVMAYIGFAAFILMSAR